MENLLAQVPELKLTKKIEKRTTHFKDIDEAVFLKNAVGKVGDVVTLEIWTDDNGYQWTRADVIHHMKVNNLIDTANELINDIKVHNAKSQEAKVLQPVTINENTF